MIDKIKLNSKEQNMLKTVERFLEKEINESDTKIMSAALINRRLVDLFNTYHMISLGDIMDLVTSIKFNVGIGQAHSAPSPEYYAYGYTYLTGFKCRVTSICNLNATTGQNSAHLVMEFNEPIKIES